MQIFKEEVEQTLIFKIKQFLLFNTTLPKIIKIIRLLIKFIVRDLLNKGELKKIKDFLSLNKDEVNSINKFIFEEQGIRN